MFPQPASFETFIKALDYFEEPDHTEDFWRFLYGQTREDLGNWEPNQEQVKRILDLMIKAVVLEKPTAAIPRLRALEILAGYNQHPGEPKFAGVKVHRFAFQAALRVREPRLINQGDLGLCGPNSITIAFAKNDPPKYAQLCVDLMNEGVGKFNNLEVKASDALKRRILLLGLHDVDYVVLGSLRGEPSLLDYLIGNQKGGIAEGVFIGKIKEYLRKGGYGDVQDHTYSCSLPFQNKLRNVKEAAFALSKGRVVVLAISGTLASLMTQAKESEVNALRAIDRKSSDTPRKAGSGDLAPRPSGSYSPDHFVLASEIFADETDVTLKLYSYGESVRRTLPADRFLTYYYGHISASLAGVTKDHMNRP